MDFPIQQQGSAATAPNAIFARWLRGQRCPQPWILNAGYAEAILLDSNAAARHYLALGFDERKIKVIGGAMEDVLHGTHLNRVELRQRLVEKYKLDPSLPIVICGFPRINTQLVQRDSSLVLTTICASPGSAPSRCSRTEPTFSSFATHERRRKTCNPMHMAK